MYCIQEERDCQLSGINASVTDRKWVLCVLSKCIARDFFRFAFELKHKCNYQTCIFLDTKYLWVTVDRLIDIIK